jgi:hypothetical protein
MKLKTMKNLKEHIEKIEFDYVVSYSGLRGERLDSARKEIKMRRREIEEEIKTANFKEKTILREKLSSLQGLTNLYNSRTINESGELHLTSIEIAKLNRDDKRLSRILEILSENCDVPDYMRCPPIYRDSIVFYDNQHSIKGILHFCFECCAIADKHNNQFDTNGQILFSLQSELEKIGHPIESA